MMVLQISISSETEARLRRQASATGKDLASLVVEAVEEKLAASDTTSEDNHSALSADQWLTEFRQWVASHSPLPYEADDSRESIYAGRGE